MAFRCSRFFFRAVGLGTRLSAFQVIPVKFQDASGLSASMFAAHYVGIGLIHLLVLLEAFANKKTIYTPIEGILRNKLDFQSDLDRLLCTWTSRMQHRVNTPRVEKGRR